jgi:WD40 repeat protein/DNA-binding SARP family transcriptional activator
VGITVLGPIGIDGLADRLGRRDRVVLGVLALLPGHASTLDRLVDALWREAPPKSADKVAQGCVMRLRKQLGREAIETSELGYTLALVAEEVDAHRFERLVGRGRELLALGETDRASYVLGEALGLWHGRPYPELEGWSPADFEASRLVALRLDAEELAVAAALDLGHHDEVAAQAFAMVQAEPTRERRWALLARAHYQAGRQEEALRAIRDATIMLRDTLGLDPNPGLVALEQAILRQDDSVAAFPAGVRAGDACPYKGLLPYDVEDGESFFGREADLASCLRVLTDTGTLTVVGPSGCGKSSLVRAGIAAALGRRGRKVVVVTPGAHPVEALTAPPGRGDRPVLVVDQFEEAFSLCEDTAERDQFVAALVEHAATAPLVMAARADSLAELAAYPSLARLVESGLHLLGGMPADDLRAAIVSPARQVGLIIEPGLVDLLLRDVEDEPGALPLLSHALLETWKRREGNTLTVDGYRDSGAIRGAVAQSAERVYAGIEPGQRQLMRHVLLRLVTYGGAGEPVRSRVPRRLLGADPQIDGLVDALVTARLVSSDAGVLEVSHEALARAWPRLHAWLEDDVEGQRIRHHLTAAADAWDSMGRPDSEVYRGIRLARALEWRSGRGALVTDTETAFLDASQEAARSEERSAEERAHLQMRMIRRLRGSLVVAAVLVLVAVIAGVVAVRQADRAETSARIADARRVGARALVTDDISASMLLAVAGARLDDSPATRANLTSVIAQHPALIRSTPYDGEAITGLDVSPDGGTLAAYDLLGGVRLYDTTSFDPVATLEPELADKPQRWFGPVAFSPDGETLAVGAPALHPDPVRLLDATTLDRLPTRLAGLPELPSRVHDVTFSADGSTLAAAVERFDGHRQEVGNSVLVWDVRDPTNAPLLLRKPLDPEAFAGWGSMVALSPDGKTLYTSTRMAAYDVATGAELYSNPTVFDTTGVPNHNADYFELSPDGSLIAVTQIPDRLLLVDAQTGEIRRRLRGHDDKATGVRFSHDGTMLASVSPDRTAIIWQVSNGKIRERLELGEADAQALAFSPDDTTLYTGGAGRSIREWDLDGARRFVARLVPPGRLTWGGGAPAPGGRYVVNTGPFFTRFLDLRTLTWTKKSPPLKDYYGNAWNRAGDEFVTLGAGFVKIWDPDTGRVARQATLDDDIWNGAFARDDTWLVVIDAAGVVTTLDAQSLEQVRAPVQLDGTREVFGLDPEGNLLIHLTGTGADPFIESVGRGWELVDLRTGNVVNEGQVSFDIRWMVSSPDGHHAAVGGTTGDVVILDLDTGRALRPPVAGHGSRVWTLAYSADGSRLVTSGEDGSVSLWDGASGELLGSVVLPERVITDAAFGPDADTVVIATEYASVYLWDSRPTRAIEFACTVAGRDFSRAEWEEAFGDRPYQETCPQT